MIVIGRTAGTRVAGHGVEGFARSCASGSEVLAGLYHIWQVAPGVGGGVPGDRAVADGKVDLATRKQPPAVVNTGGGVRAERRQIGDRSIVPGVGAWIVAISRRFAIAAARVNIAAEGHCHEALVGKWVVCGHGPAVCGDIVNLDMKIGTHAAACDAVDFAVEVDRGLEVRGYRIRWQARVIAIADRVVAPKVSSG